MNEVDRQHGETPIHLAMRSFNDALQQKMTLPGMELITELKNLSPENFVSDKLNL